MSNLQLFVLVLILVAGSLKVSWFGGGSIDFRWRPQNHPQDRGPVHLNKPKGKK